MKVCGDPCVWGGDLSCSDLVQQKVNKAGVIPPPPAVFILHPSIMRHLQKYKNPTCVSRRKAERKKLKENAKEKGGTEISMGALPSL